MKIQIEQATPDKASHIASLIMEAMNAQCCQNFAGPQHTLVDFHRMMTKLVEMEDSQYSYKNTLVAMSTDGILVGILVAYDGADVKRLRKRFIEAAIVAFGMDYSAMELETEEGEFYLDSLAVSNQYRGKGIASKLLDAVGLLCDKGNPKAERLYTKVGFQYVNDTTWSGHAMKHLQYKL